MTDDLGRLRVLMGKMGLPQDTFSHLPPEEERQALIEFGYGLMGGLEKRGMTLEQYVDTIDPISPEDEQRVVRLPDRRTIARGRGGVR